MCTYIFIYIYIYLYIHVHTWTFQRVPNGAVPACQFTILWGLSSTPTGRCWCNIINTVPETTIASQHPKRCFPKRKGSSSNHPNFRWKLAVSFRLPESGIWRSLVLFAKKTGESPIFAIVFSVGTSRLLCLDELGDFLVIWVPFIAPRRNRQHQWRLFFLREEITRGKILGKEKGGQFLRYQDLLLLRWIYQKNGSYECICVYIYIY